MIIYVYQNGDEYGAGYDQNLCERRGRIVEKWPVNSVSEARFAASHGSAHGDVSKRVSELADAAKALYTDTLTNPIILDESEWQLLVAEKQSFLEHERDDAIDLVRDQKDIEIELIKSQKDYDIRSLNLQNDSHIGWIEADHRLSLRQCVEEKGKIIDNLVNRKLLARIALSFRIVFMRKT